MIKVVLQFASMEEEAGFSCFRSVKPSVVTDISSKSLHFFFPPPEKANALDCSNFNLVLIWNNFFVCVFKNTTFTQHHDADDEMQCAALVRELRSTKHFPGAGYWGLVCSGHQCHITR